MAETHSSLLVKAELFANPAQQDVTLNLVPLTDTEFLQRLEVNPKSATFRCLKQLGTRGLCSELGKLLVDLLDPPKDHSTN